MEKLQVNIILEILGRPADHVQSALNAIIEKIAAEKGVTILQKTIHNPVPVPEATDLFTSFAEITLALDSLEQYFSILFAYMPSHIELVAPERITLRNDELNTLANKLVMRLHDYDAIAKNITFERDKLVQKLREVAPHLFTPSSASSQESKEKKEIPKKAKKNKKQK